MLRLAIRPTPVTLVLMCYTFHLYDVLTFLIISLTFFSPTVTSRDLNPVVSAYFILTVCAC